MSVHVSVFVADNEIFLQHVQHFKNLKVMSLPFYKKQNISKHGTIVDKNIWYSTHTARANMKVALTNPKH